MANMYSCHSTREAASCLAPVGAGRGARLAVALRALVGIAAVHRRALRLRIGHAARSEGQVPAPPAIGADEGRKRCALLPGEAYDLAPAAAEARALPQHFGLGLRLRRHLPGRGIGAVGGE